MVKHGLSALDALDAISKADAPWKWARPVAWRGLGIAICFDPPHWWKQVPTDRGGQTATLPAPKYLFGEWEVVEPRVVNEEVDRG